MRRIRVQLYTLVVVALVLISCTADPASPNNANQSLATTPGGPTDTPSLPTPVGSFVYPTPIPTQQAVETMMAKRAAEGTPTPITPEGKIAPDLKQAMATNPQHVEFFATLSEQADLNGAESLSGDTRHQYVYDKLQEVANRTQPAVESQLKQLQQTGDVITYTAFWLDNSFYVVGTAKAVNVLAQRTDITSLTLNHYNDGVDISPHNSLRLPLVLFSTYSRQRVHNQSVGVTQLQKGMSLAV